MRGAYELQGIRAEDMKDYVLFQAKYMDLDISPYHDQYKDKELEPAKYLSVPEPPPIPEELQDDKTIGTYYFH